MPIFVIIAHIVLLAVVVLIGAAIVVHFMDHPEDLVDTLGFIFFMAVLASLGITMWWWSAGRTDAAKKAQEPVPAERVERQ